MHQPLFYRTYTNSKDFTMSFELHPQLVKDTDVIGHFPLSIALLHKDQAVPWVILVPKRENAKELHHLPIQDQQQFLLESQNGKSGIRGYFST